MARAFNRIVKIASTTNFAYPFEDVAIYPPWETLTAEAIAVLERPFTDGNDPGPNGLIQAEGYNYARDSVTLDLVPTATAIFDNSLSPITL